MPCFICTTCGTQHADSSEPPSGCRICQDDRQYVGLGGQHWTTQDALAETHENHVEELEPGLWSVETRPAFGIGQRAHLLHHAGGTILWDCVSLIDQETADRIAELGGVDAIAVSHPHFYSSIVDWSEAFGGVPIYLHNDDARWVCRPDPRITSWAGDTYPAGEGVTLVRCGGHFEGSTLLHWAAGADGRGALLGSDTVKVGWDLASVSVMRSYPNLIPLGPSALNQVEGALEPLAYDRIYGAWTGHVIRDNARDIVAKSISRYRAAIVK